MPKTKQKKPRTKIEERQFCEGECPCKKCHPTKNLDDALCDFCVFEKWKKKTKQNNNSWEKGFRKELKRTIDWVLFMNPRKKKGEWKQEEIINLIVKSFSSQFISNFLKTQRRELLKKVRCGDANPKGNIALTRKGGCGKELKIQDAYRCTGCGGWFHKECILKHFELEKEHDWGRKKERQNLLKEIEQIMMDTLSGATLREHKELDKMYKKLEKLK